MRKSRIMTTTSTLPLIHPTPIKKTNHNAIDSPHVAVEVPLQAMAHYCGHGFLRFHAATTR